MRVEKPLQLMEVTLAPFSNKRRHISNEPDPGQEEKQDHRLSDGGGT